MEQKEQNTYVDIYPFNIIKEAFGEEKCGYVFANGLMEEIGKLEDRQKKILQLRFKEGKSFKECGESFKVTTERARQIYMAALNKLTNPNCSKKFFAVPELKKGMIEREKFNLAKSDNHQLMILEEKFERSLKSNVVKDLLKKESVNPATALEVPIRDIGFSSRTYYNLYKYGIRNVNDLVSLSEKEILRIRNLGKSSVDEIKYKLWEYGLLLK